MNTSEPSADTLARARWHHQAPMHAQTAEGQAEDVKGDDEALSFLREVLHGEEEGVQPFELEQDFVTPSHPHGAANNKGRGTPSTSSPWGDPCEYICRALRVRKAYGRNYVLYQRSDGCMLTVGPHWPGIIFTVCFICVASWYFIHNVARKQGVAFVVVGVVYTLMTILTFLRTSCANPGFITSHAPESLPRRKYCTACKLYIPPDAGHCIDCDICIEKMDHHCVSVGHCIGGKNMAAFMCFNCVWIGYVLFVLVVCAIDARLFG